eukprot:TRINITY_DN5923_c0_g1_i1.p1 TRINITY_DN5923_c0_g1~~TRINITY_DN5923_c0_g1_i1.p1  ORF type:complete len:281 (+),score=105.20 TRINITY_DN5923_c0_g1_i1:85-927(+)
MAAGPMPAERSVSRRTWTAFAAWTALFWGATGVHAVLFFTGVLDFPTSAKASLYGISVWLNGWVIPWLLPGAGARDKHEVWHECLSLWLVSYALTNLLWEIPWVICSPYVFDGVRTLDDVVGKTEWMRESAAHMYFWVIASFGTVDLRTVNQDSTFYTLELYAFVNVASVALFFYLNKRRSPLRYSIPVLGGGEPVASTFIFSFSEVFGGFKDMAGGVADTLLALVWTQYQYFVFPLIFGAVGYQLLHADWLQTAGRGAEAERSPLLPEEDGCPEAINAV